MENVEEIFDRKCSDEGWHFDNPEARKFIYKCMEEARAKVVDIHKSNLINGDNLIREIEKRGKNIVDGYVDYGETAAFELKWIKEFIKKEQVNFDNTKDSDKYLQCDKYQRELLIAFAKTFKYKKAKFMGCQIDIIVDRFLKNNL